MKIVLADINKELTQAWRIVFSGFEAVEIHEGSIFDVEADAIVSPANSYGYMDGGLDLRLSEFLGWHVQDRLQERIRNKHHGELLVGVADIVPTDHAKFPYLISAPTMRVPMVLGRASVNAYLAMRGILILVQHGTFDDGTPINSKVNTIVVPGLGTGVGQVPADICALQMAEAVNEIVLGNKVFPGSWIAALRRQEYLIQKYDANSTRS
jgi:O-acetyl-ADP-ribose deacetylase (regulator of RNase III)